MSRHDTITVRGARVHNLKNITVSIPKNSLVVITGKSGSGKSSLALDTLYAEGQRRYVESLSAYARQFLEQMRKPDVDAIEGLSPAIAIDQRTVSGNPRSTVATITEIYDYLRVLFARAGTPLCWRCGREISSQTVQEMVDCIAGLPAGTKLLLLAPVVRGRKGEFARELARLRKDGFVRVRIDGEIIALDREITLEANRTHTIEVVVDRLVVQPGMETRLADSLQTALQCSGGIVIAAVPGGEEICFNEHLACPDCGLSYSEISPRSFSFNSPYGACPDCAGLGTRVEFDPELVIPDTTRSLNEGAVAPWGDAESWYVKHLLASVARHAGFSLDTPFRDLADTARYLLLHGSGEEKIKLVYRNDAGTRSYSTVKPFPGILALLARRYRESGSEKVRDELSQYMDRRPCPTCKGARLRRESLHVMVDGNSIHDVTKMSVAAAREFFLALRFTGWRAQIALPLVREIGNRLTCLDQLGLGYLSLDRHGATLSGGEAHRIRLATQLGTRLSGVLYVLDEPSVGLHARDTERLLAALRDLRDIGNTVVVVEHDEATIRSADYCVDLGPGAGRDGGSVVAAGTPGRIARSKKSLTGQYLAGTRRVQVPPRRRTPDGRCIRVSGATENNLQKIAAAFPVGLLTCVTGVSGSGKSTLVLDTLYRAFARHFHLACGTPGRHHTITGTEFIDKVIDIDQSPIGRTPRSNPATFTGLFTPLRDLFAGLPEARLRGYGPGRFSFNVKGGRCEACQGDGLIKIEMHFLPDMYVTCDVCAGMRYNRETLEVCYRGMNIAEVLSMTIGEGRGFFENIPALRTRLDVLAEVGLDYLQLGQQATTLSGGEAQRLKLARELARKSTGRTLYILDEPTTGLHVDDVQQLLSVLHRLVDRGNTVIVIEHNLDVIQCADYVIDLGPEGGAAGGQVVAAGTPEDICTIPGSHTGVFLRRHLACATPAQVPAP